MYNIKILKKITLITIAISLLSTFLSINKTYCKYVIELRRPTVRIRNIDKEAPYINENNYYEENYYDIVNKPITINYRDNVKVKRGTYSYNTNSNDFSNSTETSFDSGLTFDKEGWYKIVVSDTTNNVTKYNFLLDTTIPEVKGIEDSAVYYKDRHITYLDNLSGIDTAYYYYSPTEEFTNVQAKSFESETVFGDFGYYKVVLTDKAKNINTIQFSIIEDTIKPEMAKLSTTETNDDGSTFTIAAEDKESGVAKIELYIKDTLYKTYNYSDYQTSKKETIDVSVWDLPFYEDAYVVVTDYYGNTTTSEKVKPNTSRIRNKVDMYKFSSVVNGTDTFSNKTVYLLQDIDLESSETNQWTPIGDYSTNTSYLFEGTFEGNNHTISGLYINNTKYYQGLFGYNLGVIKNLNIEDCNIKAFKNVGPITRR